MKTVTTIAFALLFFGAWTFAYSLNPIGASCITGMVSYWQFNLGSGTTAYDSADANNGTIYGATWTTGMVDDALGFDGVNDYVDLGAGSNLDIAGLITMEAWIEPETVVGNNPILVRWNDVNGPYRQYYIEIRGGRVRFMISQNGGVVQMDFVQGNTLLCTGKWYHVAGVYDGSHLEVYLNGSSDGSKTTSITSIYSYSQDAFIGYGKVDEAANFFNGTIDEVAIYNRTLTPEEIHQHYSNGLLHRDYCALPVGGVLIPIDKLELLAPYIVLATVVVAVTAGSLYAGKRWHRKTITH